MQDAMYCKCANCGYEFLAKIETTGCPRCKSDMLESKDVKILAGIDE